MKKYLFLLLATMPFFSVYAQKSLDVQAIKAQCGCFDVKFAYAETFSPQKEYKFKDRYTASGTEYVLVIEESKDKIVIQHLLVTGDTMVIKHWREDWIHENQDFLSFHKDRAWKYGSIPKDKTKKTWTQKVFEVNDEPRYEGHAQWSHLNNKHLWESTVDAPLPRREYTKRSDYNVMKRGNRISITPYGYLHEQDNDKIIRKEGTDELLAQEKGLNDYRRTDTKKCAIAQKWWQEHEAFWRDVRAAWQNIFNQKKNIFIKQEVDGKKLYQALDILEKEKNDSATNRQKLGDILAKFVTVGNDLIGQK